jgi:hypothetical protein
VRRGRYDIDPILERWGPGPGHRRIRGTDGAEKIQMRVEVNGHRGILQFNCDGRPDGERPHGREFALDYQQTRLERLVRKGGSAAEFRLSRDEARELIDEAVLTYQRYIVLLQMKDFARVVRDTDRNMRLFRFVKRHAESGEDAQELDRWWPYIIRIHHTARALEATSQGDNEGALAAVREARAEIVSLPEQENATFLVERARSEQALKELEEAFEREIEPDLSEAEATEPEATDRAGSGEAPDAGASAAGRIARLEAEKLRAVQSQDFERAARLRDEIRKLRSRPGPGAGAA